MHGNTEFSRNYAGSLGGKSVRVFAGVAPVLVRRIKSNVLQHNFHRRTYIGQTRRRQKTGMLHNLPTVDWRSTTNVLGGELR